MLSGSFDDFIRIQNLLIDVGDVASLGSLMRTQVLVLPPECAVAHR